MIGNSVSGVGSAPAEALFSSGDAPSAGFDFDLFLDDSFLNMS